MDNAIPMMRPMPAPPRLDCAVRREERIASTIDRSAPWRVR
jgi:hypothetical protein